MDRLEDVNSIAPILVGGLQDPIVASTEVTGWHQELGRVLSRSSQTVRVLQLALVGFGNNIGHTQLYQLRLSRGVVWIRLVSGEVGVELVS